MTGQSTFQQTVNFFNPLGFIGGLAFQGPTRAVAANINSSGTANLFGNVYTFTAAATADPTAGAANGATAQVGGTGTFAGILFNPKENVLTGVTGNPLGASIALADNSVGDLMQMGYLFVNLPGVANPGDLVTYDPATGNLNSVAPTAVFVGSSSTTTLTVASVTSGVVQVGQTISGSGVVPGTIITALGSGLGGAGTYTISVSQTIGASTTITAAALPAPAAVGLATFATNVMTVSTATSGEWVVGQTILGAGVPANTRITAYGTGAGGTGTYTLNQTVGTITPAIAVTTPANLFVPNCTVERYQANALGGVAVIKLTN